MERSQGLERKRENGKEERRERVTEFVCETRETVVYSKREKKTEIVLWNALQIMFYQIPIHGPVLKCAQDDELPLRRNQNASRFFFHLVGR